MHKISIRQLLIANKLFLIPIFILFLLGLYPLYAFDKISLFLIFNRLHHPLLDYFFTYITWIGSSITYGIFLVGLLWIKVPIRKLVIGGTSFCLMSVIVQSMKHVFFADCFRPLSIIPANVVVHIVDGIPLNKGLSFPSGHSSTIFTATCFLHLIIKKKKILYSCFLILSAILIAYSRLYLCQHFYKDIYIGALIGIGTTLFVYTILINWEGPTWLDKRIG